MSRLHHKTRLDSDQLTRELADVVAMPAWLQEACEKRGGDHLIDALVCALIARAADLNRLEPIPSEALSRATQEGWIRLPAAQSIQESLNYPKLSKPFPCSGRPFGYIGLRNNRRIKGKGSRGFGDTSRPARFQQEVADPD